MSVSYFKLSIFCVHFVIANHTFRTSVSRSKFPVKFLPWLTPSRGVCNLCLVPWTRGIMHWAGFDFLINRTRTAQMKLARGAIKAHVRTPLNRILRIWFRSLMDLIRIKIFEYIVYRKEALHFSKFFCTPPPRIKTHSNRLNTFITSFTLYFDSSKHEEAAGSVDMIIRVMHPY